MNNENTNRAFLQAHTYSHNWVAGRNALLSFILMDTVSVFSSFS